MRWIVLALGLTFPGALSLLDCTNRRSDEFAGGASDRKGSLCVVGVGYGIVLGYCYGVVRRNSPMRR